MVVITMESFFLKKLVKIQLVNLHGQNDEIQSYLYHDDICRNGRSVGFLILVLVWNLSAIDSLTFKSHILIVLKVFNKFIYFSVSVRFVLIHLYMLVLSQLSVCIVLAPKFKSSLLLYYFLNEKFVKRRPADPWKGFPVTRDKINALLVSIWRIFSFSYSKFAQNCLITSIWRIFFISLFKIVAKVFEYVNLTKFVWS